MKKYKIKCKKCGNKMNYIPLKKLSRNSIKKCVYCGFNIKAKDHLC